MPRGTRELRDARTEAMLRARRASDHHGWYPGSEMTLAIDLPHVLLVRVEARAQERGMALTEYVAKLIEEALPAEPNARGVSLLKAWEAEDATDDPAELEAR